MDANAGGVVTAPAVDEGLLAKQLASGASWFFFIGGLSLANSLLALADANRTFLVGLAVTQMADAFASVAIERGGPEGLRYVALGFDALVAGIFVVAGVLANRRARWAYLAGMVLYMLDAVICGLFRIWTHLGFHVFALFFLWRGFSALRQLTPAPRRISIPAAQPNRLMR